MLPSSLVIGSNESGLSFIDYKNNTFTAKNNLPGLSAFCQFTAIDNNGFIWVAHPYRGIYKIDISQPAHSVVKLYTDKNGLPSYLNNHLFKIKNRMLLLQKKVCMNTMQQKIRFEESQLYQPFFSNKNIRHLKEDSKGNVWFVEDKNLGVIDFSGDKPAIIYFSELNGKMVSGFEYIYPYDDRNIFVGAEKGFYHINYEEYKKNTYPAEVKIRSVKAFGKTDTLLFGGYYGEVNAIAGQLKNAVPNLANQWSSVHFEYSSPITKARTALRTVII